MALDVTQSDSRAISTTARFNFLDVKVFRQLDSKFICCMTQESHSHQQLFVLDQHAVHERICLERLQKCKRFTSSQAREKIYGLSFTSSY